MWAHYGQNHEGFVIGFDTKVLQDNFPETSIHQIEYRTSPDPSISTNLEYAAATMKRRHSFLAMQQIYHSAYFSKHDSWSYEREIRMVDQAKYCKYINKMHILEIDSSVISEIIIGANAPNSLIDKCNRATEYLGIDYYTEVIGKNSIEPYFRGPKSSIHIFDKGTLQEIENCCGSCGEPLDCDGFYCNWCSITEDEEYRAASGNQMRHLARLGLDPFEGY